MTPYRPTLTTPARDYSARNRKRHTRLKCWLTLALFWALVIAAIVIL